MEKTMTEREVFEWKMGRTMTDEELHSLGPKRNLGYLDDQINRSTHVYKRCDLCKVPICINNWEDGKSRTPRFKGFVICPSCDPRHAEDRYMKEGYRILHPGRLNIVRYAQIARALSKFGCISTKQLDYPCKCAGCAAVRLFADV